MEKVYFIGAGPGDPELITVKGQRIVKEADVIIYAGSLVPKEVINCHKDGAEIYNSASMSLDEVIDVTIKAVKTGKKVARVHTGDPAIYGAHREQMDMLDEYGIEYEVIPGVSSFLAAAAAIKKEFTLPNVSQTVICTRIEGKTAVPEKEKLESLAEHRASMAIFLSVQMIDKVVKTLSTSYPLTTPVAVVQKASWPDQKIVFGTLETIEEKVKEAVAYIDQHLFTTPLWLYPQEITDKIGVDVDASILGQQNTTLAYLLAEGVVYRIANQALVSQNPYTADEYLNDVFAAVWKPLNASDARQNTYRRGAQRAYIEQLGKLINPENKTDKIALNQVSDVRIFALQNLNKVEKYLQQAQQGEAANSINQLHYQQLLKDINNIKDPKK